MKTTHPGMTREEAEDGKELLRKYGSVRGCRPVHPLEALIRHYLSPRYAREDLYEHVIAKAGTNVHPQIVRNIANMLEFGL